MAKSLFVCQSCGAEHRKWMGQCPDCGEWNTIEEQFIQETGPHRGKARPLPTKPITEIAASHEARLCTNIEELDRVLGGGLVRDSAVLIGGDPGIGKSTLLLQAAAKLAAKHDTLYITGEESLQQVRLRGERIGASNEQLRLLAACDLESILATLADQRPAVVIIDSIQTMVSSRLSSAPGTVSQVRDCSAALIQQAKQQGFALILVGHVTKEGTLAGPRVLEHMVDTVLYFEGDKGHAHRILRAVKNRFGPAGEIGVFEMTDSGLMGIRDASRLFLAERIKDTPGSIVLACLEGTRPMLVEVQALIAPTVYATPKRTAVGLDSARVAMLTAVLERRMGLPLTRHDVYVNVAGGARIREPAADLAILMAMVSAYRDRPFPADLAVFGEVGLTGEVRPVGQPEARANEALGMGFHRLVIPKDNEERLHKALASTSLTAPAHASLRLTAVRHLSEATRAGFSD
ncbi:MAG: DNA repair protein RadA [Zetaproteobacteria bacterium]|nr:MAG: DNA repair protein RadA [Zetaproteobacteria bacterium]